MDETVSSNWKRILMGCGSNAFGQLLMEGELMSSVLKPIIIGSHTSDDIDCISCYSNSSAIIFDDNYCNIWGEGLSGLTSSLKIPLELKITTKVSCLSLGLSHAGLVTITGQIFTWGKNDYNQLGHGSNKQSVNTPKLLLSHSNRIGLKISCGSFHTAIVSAESIDKVVEIDVSQFQFNESNCILRAGQLFTFGFNRANQLGLGNRTAQLDQYHKKIIKSNQNISSPTLIKQFDDDNLVVFDVSCGFHHTLVVAVSKLSILQLPFDFKSFAFSFGFGEHGRLGLGDEESRTFPCAISFPSIGFNPVQISAGEQHSLVSGFSQAADCNCFSFGSNHMGQLGAGNSKTMESSCFPVPVLIPASMNVVKVVAGGRHSAAITSCGKVLTFGWSEDGQLGHANEKSNYLPRPLKIPRYCGEIGTPIDISLGMSHTVVILNNPNYVKPEIPAEILSVPVPEPVLEETLLKAEIVEEFISSVELIKELSMENNDEVPLHVCSETDIENIGETVIHQVIEPDLHVVDQEIELADTFSDLDADSTYNVESEHVLPKSAVFITDDFEDMCYYSKPVRGIKELFQLREVDDRLNLDDKLQKDVETQEPLQTQSISPSQTEIVNVFYREGQNLEKCLVANSAKRAELRKLKKHNNSSVSSIQQSHRKASKL